MKNWIRSSLVSLKERETPIFIGTFIILVFFRIWLITGIPKMFLYAPHDDLFFAKAAHYIIHGQWMGPYSQMTLIKGPFYAFFLIFSFFTGLPLLLNETIFYIIACTVLFFAMSPLINNYWWRLLPFILLLFSPASLATYWTLRVYREFVYFSLTLFVIAFSIGLFLRIDRKLSSVIFWATGLGISMGAFMLCREEGVWIYPILLLLLVSCAMIIWFKKMDHRWFRSTIIFSSVITWYIPIFIVSYLNYSYYGFWGYSENMGNDFNRVINTIGRIKTSTSTWYPYNAITREGFVKAYNASPLLDELKMPIETIWNMWQYWADFSMSGLPNWYREKYLVEGAQSMNSHIMFLFRDALAIAGYYSNGRYPHEYLRELADQLEAACNNGTLDCSPGTNIPYVGSIKAEQFPIILKFFGDNIDKLLKFDVGQTKIASLEIKNWPADQVEFNYFEEFVYNPIGPQYFGETQNNDQLVGGKTNISLKMLQYKKVIMMGIQSIYIIITLPGFVILCSGWLVLLFYNFLRRQQRHFPFQALLIFLFLLGLLISRIMMLALISANSNVYMIGYSTSCYVFIYLIFFLMLFYLVDQTTRLIFLNRKKDFELIFPKIVKV
jgi:hypothetical protein